MTVARLDRTDPGTPRRIALSGRDVDYRLIRARRRTIGMEIDLDGLTVRAPRWVTIAEVEGALHERGAWVLRTLEAWRGRRRDVLPREWKTGAPILYLGRELSFAVFRSRAPLIRADLFDLTVLHPQAHDQAQVAGRSCRSLASGRSRAAGRSACSAFRRAARSARPAGEDQQRSQRVGKLQPPRPDPSQLAARPAAAGACRLRRRARDRALGRAQPLAALLGGRGKPAAGPRRARRALDEWTALLAA